MRDTYTDHFEPLRFDRVGSRGQGRSKYGARVILILTKFGILISTWFQIVPFGL